MSLPQFTMRGFGVCSICKYARLMDLVKGEPPVCDECKNKRDA